MPSYAVGEVAALLGVSPSTVRMWGRRYGIEASGRSPGGHRRYAEADLARLRELARRGPGAPGGAVLGVPRAGRAAQSLARAASRLDQPGVEDEVGRALAAGGTLAAWDEVVRPVLVAAGTRWERTGGGIEVEHLLSQAVTTALVRHAGGLRVPTQDRPVLLAGGPREEHVLVLHAAQAALLEVGVPARVLGARTPLPALEAAARRTRAAAAVVWLVRSDRTAVREVTALAPALRRTRVVVSGPGWRGRAPAGTELATSLPELVDRLAETWATVRK